MHHSYEHLVIAEMNTHIVKTDKEVEYTRDENPPYCNAIWHYFSAILQILNTNRRITNNAIRGVSGSDVALLALF